LTKPAIAGRISKFVQRCRDAVSWRAYVLRQRYLAWQAERKIRQAASRAAGVIRQLAKTVLHVHSGRLTP